MHKFCCDFIMEYFILSNIFLKCNLEKYSFPEGKEPSLSSIDIFLISIEG